MNIYCFSTLSFAKLQFKSVINKAFHKHGSHLLQMRGLKPVFRLDPYKLEVSHLLQMRGLKPVYRKATNEIRESHLLQMRGLKQQIR